MASKPSEQSKSSENNKNSDSLPLGSYTEQTPRWILILRDYLRDGEEKYQENKARYQKI